MIASRLSFLLAFTIGIAFAQPEEITIPMRDGVKMATDLYFPEGPRKDLPVVLERLPYNKKILASRGAYFAARGYVFAAQDVRGRFRSEGRFEPFLREGPDGYDSIEWLARQSWSSRRVGTIGASYGALAQWQTALLHPPHLAAMVVSGSPMDRVAFENGIFSLMNFAAWLNIIYRQKSEDESPLDAMKGFHSDFSILPVVDQDLKAFGRIDEVWRRWCTEEADADYWQPMRVLSKMDQITVPVLHQSGWFDGGSLATKNNYLALAKAGAKNQRLIIGPWEHQDYASRNARGRDFGEAALIDLEQEFEQWQAHWLKGAQPPAGDPVKLFVMGENRWITAQSYPPPGRPMRFFLGRASMLLPGRADKTGSDRYVYDPGNPTVSPRVLGDAMELRYAELLNGQDVLVYRSLPLSAALGIVGPMSATLHVSANVPETDIFVRISEQDPERGHFLLAEGKRRVRFAGERPVRVEVDLWHTAVRIAKGHRIIIDITSAAYPIYARNLNTGENSLTGTKFRKATVTVHRGVNTPSFVELSVVP